LKECKKYLKLVSASIDGILSKEEEELLQKHLKECENCKKAKEEMEKISKELKNLDLILPNKARIKINKSELFKPYRFQITNIFPFLFALVFFILVFLLWQNIKQKGYPFCLEVKEEITDKFPKLIKRIQVEKEVPKDFFIILELNLEEGKEEFKVLETNYKDYSHYFIKELKKWEWENFEKKKYYLKIYSCL